MSGQTGGRPHGVRFRFSVDQLPLMEGALPRKLRGVGGCAVGPRRAVSAAASVAECQGMLLRRRGRRIDRPGRRSPCGPPVQKSRNILILLLISLANQRLTASALLPTVGPVVDFAAVIRLDPRGKTPSPALGILVGVRPRGRTILPRMPHVVPGVRFGAGLGTAGRASVLRVVRPRYVRITLRATDTAGRRTECPTRTGVAYPPHGRSSH